ncbi:MAG TPA: hypothetical protein VGG33_02640 [Polyangia bacterium]
MTLRQVALLMGLATVVSCAGRVDENSPAGGPSGPRAGSSGSNPGNSAGSSGSGGATGAPVTNPPGGTGTGGSASSGSGGSSGYGGSSGSGGSSGGAQDASPPRDGAALPDGGAGSDAAADASMPPPEPCSVTIAALSPPRFSNVPAGEGYHSRVTARIRGTSLPAKLDLRWDVRRGTVAVATKAVDGEPATIEFPTLDQGIYTVSVTVADVMPVCSATASLNAVVPSQRIESFFLRVTPPASRTLPPPAGTTVTGLPLGILETQVTVAAGVEATTKSLEFEVATPIRIDPTDERGNVLPAYFVQISSPTSTARQEGYITNGASPGDRGFLTQLYPHTYDVLIVPDEPDRAPILYQRHLDQFGVTLFRVDQGTRVSGLVKQVDTPLPDVRLRLRDEALVSTVGKTNAQGAFTMLVRPGRADRQFRFEARVIPPAETGLPEAQLAQTSGITVGSGGVAGDITFTYKALEMVALTVNLTAPAGGAPATPVSVVVESVADEFADVGTFSVPGQGDLVARGRVRQVREATAGVARFDKLPRGRYRVTAVPPESGVGGAAITTLPLVDLSTGATTVSQPLALATRGQISGRLTPIEMAAGLTVRAVDTAEDGITRTTLAPVNAEGRYTIASDPGRIYRLFVEPPPNVRAPRVALLPAVRAGTAAVTFDKTLPGKVLLKGVTADPVGLPVAGAVIQAFCRGDAPTCVELAAPDISTTLPIDETVSGADGSYQLWLPNPAGL